MRHETQDRAPAANPQSKAVSPRERSTLHHVVILTLASIALYAQTLWNGFVVDDQQELVSDRAIRHLSNIPSFFAHGVWYFYGAKVDRFYRPLKFIAYSIEYQLFHLHSAPWHLVNILLDTAVVLGVYFLVRDLSSARLAFWSALLFAFFPIHVETVAWVSAGSDMQCAAAMLFSIWLYHRARLRGKPALLYAGSLALFAVALLGKEDALTFPGLILAYDFFYRRESLRRMASGWRRYASYFAVLAVYLAARIHALHGFAPGGNGGQTNAINAQTLVLTITVLIARYLGKALLPIHLLFWYTYSPTRDFGFGALGAIGLAGALVAAMFGLRRRQPTLSFAMAWFFLTLAPALDIWKVSQLFAERYFYTASFAFCVFAAWAWVWIEERASRLSAASRRKRLAQGLVYASLAGLIVFYTVVTVRRIPYWHDDLRFWLRTSEQAPNVAAVNGEVGYLYLQKQDYKDAIQYTQRAVSLDPQEPFYHTNLANIYIGLRRYGDALAEAKRAVALNPNVAPLWLNLAIVYRAENNWAQAVEACERGIAAENDPGITVTNLSNHEHELLTLLALAEWHLGHRNRAVAVYKKAIEAEPDVLDAYIDLGNAYAQMNNLNGAIAEFDDALQANPDSPDLYIIHFELGVIYEGESYWRAAALEYQQALALNPNFQIARARLQPLMPFLTNPNLARTPLLPASR